MCAVNPYYSNSKSQVKSMITKCSIHSICLNNAFKGDSFKNLELVPYVQGLLT